ncbi:MAG: hypothetical protein QOF83_1651 [Solirubrobacteraceae bacterium]|nr:hypothetical protein [Solirubrobacteraceae bacterium]
MGTDAVPSFVRDSSVALVISTIATDGTGIVTPAAMAIIFPIRRGFKPDLSGKSVADAGVGADVATAPG